MKNTKKLLVLATITAIFIGTSTSFADNNDVDKTKIKNILQNVKIGKNITDSEKEMLKYFKGGKFQHRYEKLNKIGSNLTESEKTALSSMNSEKIKEFFAKKREVNKVVRESYRKVIDKLLSGETLTSKEETLRTEIIKKRAERQKKKEETKAKRLEKQAERQKIRELFKKYRNKETLTTEEQKVVEDIKEKRKMYRGEHKKHK